MQSNVYVLRPKSGVAPTLVSDAAAAASDAAQHLLALQKADGHIVFELEADATIPSEYIFLNHFLDMREPELEAEMGEYLRSLQSKTHGGWPLFHEGGFNISASVKAHSPPASCARIPPCRRMTTSARRTAVWSRSRTR